MHKQKRVKMRAVAAILLIALSSGFVCAGATGLAAGPEIIAVISSNSSPIAKNLELTTFRNIAVTGQFEATDPDGDTVTFEVTSAPKKGDVKAEEDGSFTYTPSENKKGTDTFTYVAVDANGNVSGSATVTVTIRKQATKMTYSDMLGNGAHYAALVLAEEGILIGEQLGNEFFFRPDALVTRGEFLTMCLQMAGADTLEGITRTGFSDDASTPVWAKPYISTALMNGLVRGFKNDEGRLVFASCEPITFAEAAVLLNNILQVTDVVSVSTVSADACPAWAYQAEVNLTAVDILPVMGTTSYSALVTRADAAEMLTASMDLLDTRGSLLTWAVQ